MARPPSNTAAIDSFEAALPGMARFACTQIDQGDMGVGLQVYVAPPDTDAILFSYGADGAGNPIRDDSTFRLYCAGKPLTALAVVAACQQGLLSLSDRIGNHLPHLSCANTAALRIEQLLDHSAGLARPLAEELFALGVESRRAVALAAQVSPAVRLGGAYSEFVAWELLGLVLESVQGVPARQVVDDFARRLGIRLCLNVDAAARIGIDLDLRGDEPLPLLIERSERVIRSTSVADGVYGSMSELAGLYHFVRTGLTGSGSTIGQRLLAAMIEPRPPRYDAVLGRTCSFGLGFMTDLRHHHFGDSCGRRTFGHSGFNGSTFAFADLDHDLVIAAHWIGLIDAESSIQFRRKVLVDTIYKDLALA